MLDAAEVDTLMAMLHEHATVPFGLVPRVRRYAFVSGQMERAKSWGIDAAAMQVVFCALALAHGEGFSEQPAWRGLLAKVKAGQFGLNEAIDKFQAGAQFA